MSIGERIKQARKQLGVSQEKLAKLCGWEHQSRISAYETDYREPDSEDIAALAKALGVSKAWLFAGADDPAPPSNVVQFESKNIIIVPRLDVAGSMGNGLALPSQHIDVVESMKVSKEYLARTVSYSNVSNLAIITGYGDSMEGTFSDGDLLLVDRGVNDLKVDAVYVLALGDELYIKRIQRRPDGSMAMLSDNPKYQPYEIKNGEAEKFQVLGRVLLAWNANKL